MPQAASEGIATIFDGAQASYGPLTSATSPLISASMSVAHLQAASVQILTDGLAIVDWAMQVTNIPAVPVSRNANPLGKYPWRDNTAASNMWSTIANGVIPTGGTYQGVLISQPNVNYRNMRIVFTWDPANTGGASTIIYACVHAIGL